jgi:hypothetical protein
VLNEVVINQVFAAFGDDALTRRIIAAVQEDGTMWAGPSHWRGRSGMRLSVSSWKTTAADIDRSVEAIVRAVASVR